MLFLLFAGLLGAMLGGGGSRDNSGGDEQEVLNVGAGSGRSSNDSSDSSTDSYAASSDAIRIERQYDGHFYADVQINGQMVRMLVDTGASGIALSRDDARRAGIGVSIAMPNVVGRGASGDVRGEYVTLDRVSLGPKTGDDMEAVVLDSGGQSLLGQSFLSKFASVEIKGDTLVLR